MDLEDCEEDSEDMEVDDADSDGGEDGSDPDYSEEDHGDSDDTEDSENWEEEDGDSDGWEDGEEQLPSAAEADARNWAGLPCGVLSDIFLKVGTFYVMTTAQYVCRSWRELAWEPDTWRVVRLSKLKGFFGDCKLDGMARAAIARSNGQMEEFHAEYFADDSLIRHIAQRTNRLKRLSLISCYDVSDKALIKLAQRSPQLEYLDVCFCTFSEKLVEAVGQACPQLKHLVLNKISYKRGKLNKKDNLEAFGISSNMLELRYLEMTANRLTNVGLIAILDRCCSLESLDIRRCYNIKLDESLRKKCARIKDLKLPANEFDVDEYLFFSTGEVLSDDSYS